MGKLQEASSKSKISRSEGFYICGSGNCQYKSQRLGNVIRHKERMHSNTQQNNWSCGACEINFPDRWELQEHKKRIHNHGFKCTVPTCDWAFSRAAHLERHLATHTGTKKFRCSYLDCKYGSSTKYNLKRHIKGIHHGQAQTWTSSYPMQSPLHFSNLSRFQSLISPENFYPSYSKNQNENELVLPCPDSDCYCSLKPQAVESPWPMKKSEKSSFIPFRPWELNDSPQPQPQETTISNMLPLPLSLCYSP